MHSWFLHTRRLWWENQFQQKKDCDNNRKWLLVIQCIVRESVPTKEGLRLFVFGLWQYRHCEWENQFQQKKDCDNISIAQFICFSLWENQFQQKKDCDNEVRCSNASKFEAWENQFQQKKDCDYLIGHTCIHFHFQGERISSNKRRIATYAQGSVVIHVILWENQFQQKKDCDALAISSLRLRYRVRESVPTKEGLRLLKL